MPMGGEPEALAPHVRRLREGSPQAEVAVLTALPRDDRDAALRRIDEYARVGVTRVITGAGRSSESDVLRLIELMASLEA